MSFGSSSSSVSNPLALTVAGLACDNDDASICLPAVFNRSTSSSHRPVISAMLGNPRDRAAGEALGEETLGGEYFGAVDGATATGPRVGAVATTGVARIGGGACGALCGPEASARRAGRGSGRSKGPELPPPPSPAPID